LGRLRRRWVDGGKGGYTQRRALLSPRQKRRSGLCGVWTVRQQGGDPFSLLQGGAGGEENRSGFKRVCGPDHDEPRGLGLKQSLRAGQGITGERGDIRIGRTIASRQAESRKGKSQA
jgi:hypothetical protein